ncbi:uncharacterized protein LOC110881255 [Helianthus annuus]|uniref:uncharacterized protein LOC110881255 n=1 Tax=Helianthus annuus TaxID=4232 RepID=UPI000B909B2F|nr:uncharacterized protein LOC110881255 [Helianthus annuus]
MDHAPDEQPFEAPVAPVAPVAPIDQPPVVPADLDPAPADPVPLPDHDPIFAEIPDIAPILPDPVLMFDDHAPFATHIDPRYADTHNGWVDDDDYPPYIYHRGHTYIPAVAAGCFESSSLELERTPRPPPCHCQTPFATPPAPLPLPPDSDVRFLTPEQQIAYLLRVIHALEEDWVRLRRLIFFSPPPPPPPSA